MVIKTFLLVIIWFLLSETNCELFCNNPSIDSALTIDNQTFLFRGNHSWIFKPQDNYVSNSSLIRDTIQVSNKDNVLYKIDALFSTKMLFANGNEDKKRKLVYIFYEKQYFFARIGYCKDKPNENGWLCFGRLDSDDKKSLPPNWNIHGGTLSQWFPNKIDATLRVNDNLLLFHGPYVRYVKLYTDKAWPPDEKYDIPLDGGLKNISKIDDIFEISLTEDIVITAGHKYCKFNKNQIVVKEIPKSFNISCEWNESKYLFICETPTKATTEITTAVNSTVTNSVTTTGVTETQEQSKVDTNSTTKVAFNETTTEKNEMTDRKKENNDFVIIVSVVVFCVIVFLVIGTIIGIAYFCSHKSQNKQYGLSAPRFGEMASSGSDSVSMTSIVTVDTITGEAIRPEN